MDIAVILLIAFSVEARMPTRVSGMTSSTFAGRRLQGAGRHQVQATPRSMEELSWWNAETTRDSVTSSQRSGAAASSLAMIPYHVLLRFVPGCNAADDANDQGSEPQVNSQTEQACLAYAACAIAEADGYTELAKARARKIE